MSDTKRLVCAIGEGGTQRLLWEHADGRVTLSADKRAIVTVSREEAEEIALAHCAGAAAEQTALMRLSAWMLYLVCAHASAPTPDPAPAMQGQTGRLPSEPTSPDVPPGPAPAGDPAGTPLSQGEDAAHPDLFTATSCPGCGQ